MKTITVSAQKDFLERLASVPPIKALSELIWNGLDAGSDRIEVVFELNGLSGLEKIQVRDEGSGINYDEIEVLFGHLGNSWKKSKRQFKNRSLHGAKGEGRFKAFALGNRVEWDTTYTDREKKTNRYQIIARADSIEKPSFTRPIEDGTRSTGTAVLITEIEKSHGMLLADNAMDELAKHFAAYLTKYPSVTIQFNGLLIDPASIQDRTKDLRIDDIDLGNGKKVSVDITVIEWTTPTKRVLHLCDSQGVTLQEIEAGPHIKAPGFHFTAYIKTDRFRELDQEGFLMVGDLHSEVNAILKASRKAVHRYFRQRLAELHIPAVQRWKDQDIYPYEDKPNLTPIEEAERQVFDIVAVNVESYLPDFEESDQKSKQFIFQLLAQALRQNPESLRQIISEVLKLKPKQQEDLAELLKQTSFPAIITSAKTVANRLNFLLGLENLIFDKETKKKLLERDQLHKILERESWIFDEDFALSGSEERLEEVLKKHIGILGEREGGETSVVVGDNKTGRIDLMLSRAITPRSGEKDYLVVELKRPSQKIDDGVITQLKKYAMAVARDERFNGVPARWKFVAISNEMNDFAKDDANQRDKPSGQVWSSPDGHITVWTREWAEIINTARSRLDFVNQSLSYEANRESAREYLTKAHAKFIPTFEAECYSQDGSEDDQLPDEAS